MIREIASHRSIRRFRPDPVPEQILTDILTAATRASNTGNMQVYSIIVTRDKELRERLAPCHFNQPCAVQAPVVLTFCADVNRFSKWCRMRGAEPGYDNFLWFVNAATDTLLASQNAALEAEANGLGICYLGTTVYNAARIAEILDLPKGVAPLTTIVLGYPDESPELTDRLPLGAVVHYDKYNDPDEELLTEYWREKEESELTRRLLEENGLPNLARIFTDRRYTAKDNLAFSASYMEFLREQGFFNH